MRRVWITKEEFQKAEENYNQTGWIDWRLSSPDPMCRVKLKCEDKEWIGHLYSAPDGMADRQIVDEPLATHWMPLPRQLQIKEQEYV